MLLSSVATRSLVFSVEKVDLILWDLSIRHSFSLVPSTYGKFILILISSSWISVACVSCCDRGKLWLLRILLKILLIMLFWYQFSFNTCFILAFSLCKSSLFVIMELAILNKEEATLFLQLVWGWELECRYWSVCVGFLYTNTEISPLFCFNKVSRNASSPLLSYAIVKLIFWWRLLMWW